ncbi:hypothetical protein O95_01547 [Bartonella henselae JK 53]|uniref:hypothetical protein n=1 Tax=Bartonella henselae TaxID=38323 RepID=UPI0003DF961F|nr:hypothetical protein Q652_01324 [Bartonella henselae JK 41]KEC57864.1 hypothetical protein O95_01547 [Bartonella henselae JK 53]
MLISTLQFFIVKPSDSLSREIVGTFVRNLKCLLQQDLAAFKKLLEKVGKKEDTL